MRRFHGPLAVLAVLALIGGFGLTRLEPAHAAGTAAIEIHKRLCPAGATGDIYSQCHGNVVAQPVAFSLDGGPAVATDASGNLIFSSLDAGTYTVTETEGPPLEFVNLRVFCTVLGSGIPAVEIATSGPSFDVPVADGDHLVCDVYNLPENLSGLTPEAGAGSLEIHKRVCPGGPLAGNIFDECHGNPPAQTVAFSIDGGAPIAVDASGNLLVTGLEAGSHLVSETEGPPLEFVDLRVFCAVDGSGIEAAELPTDGPNFTVDIGPDQAVICDVYNIPENLSGLTPTSVPLPTVAPAAGRPAGIYAGTCDAIGGEPNALLTGVTKPRGTHRGSDLATEAEASFTSVEMPLPALLADEFAIAVLRSQTNHTIVVCGEIGGRARPDGSYVIGLREQNGSAFEGIAFLAASPTNPNVTNVSVFIASKLAGEDLTPTPSGG